MKQPTIMLMAIAISALLVSATFLDLTGTIDLNALENYAAQPVPAYITKDNTPPQNAITDAGATLGRVLFYDKNLSTNNTISCASCHQQAFAFGDTATLSTGVAGSTGRHSMRLVNARFGNEARFFWDERANSLEQQTTMPIQDHVEMGFSGENGDPGLDSLIEKLEAIGYYQQLFEFVYGDPEITEVRLRRALAQFVRSMQSFDSKYDAGRALVPNDGAPFPNFTPQENQGKNIFLTPVPAGGAGCQGCHRAPEFDIVPNSLNNGVTGVAGQPGLLDLTVTRSPSLRDLLNPDGQLNGPLMHNGAFGNLLEVVDHYNLIPPNAANTNLDPRLGGGPGNPGQNLELTQQQKNALVAFLGTLTGQDIYTNEKWSNPFDEQGNLTVIPFCGSGSITTLDMEICAGENFEGYAQTGTFVDTFPAANGCDSTRTLHLTVLPQAETNITAEICEGEDFEGFTQTGVYESVFQAANGCDSVRTLTLTVLPADDPACLASAASENRLESSLTVFPNPFRDEFQISCNCAGQVSYSLFDATGRRVLSGEADFSGGAVRVTTHGLAPGLYLLVGQTDSGHFSSRLAKS